MLSVRLSLPFYREIFGCFSLALVALPLHLFTKFCFEVDVALPQIMAMTLIFL